MRGATTLVHRGPTSLPISDLRSSTWRSVGFGWDWSRGVALGMGDGRWIENPDGRWRVRRFRRLRFFVKISCGQNALYIILHWFLLFLDSRQSFKMCVCVFIWKSKTRQRLLFWMTYMLDSWMTSMQSMTGLPGRHITEKPHRSRTSRHFGRMDRHWVNWGAPPPGTQCLGVRIPTGKPFTCHQLSHATRAPLAWSGVILMFESFL